jgi:hypothetical protein
MDQSLPHIVLVKRSLIGMLEQILEKILHDAIFNAFTVENHLFLLRLWILRREYLIEGICHLGHELLHLHALLLAGAIGLDYFGQRRFDKVFNGLPHRLSLVTF